MSIKRALIIANIQNDTEFFFIIIFLHFSVFLVLRSGATPQSSILCILWALI